MAQHKKERITGFGTFGLIILKLVCCGLPLLFLVLGSAGIGAIFMDSTIRWLLGTLAVLVLVILILVTFARRSRSKGKADCCTPFEKSAGKDNDSN